MREPSASDFTVELPDIGKFVYARPIIRDLIAIDKEYERIVGGDTNSVRLTVMASMIAIHKTTCVSCPNGWEDMEAVGGENDTEIGNLLLAYRGIEDSFRKGGSKDSGA